MSLVLEANEERLNWYFSEDHLYAEHWGGRENALESFNSALESLNMEYRNLAEVNAMAEEYGFYVGKPEVSSPETLPYGIEVTELPLQATWVSRGEGGVVTKTVATIKVK